MRVLHSTCLKDFRKFILLTFLFFTGLVAGIFLGSGNFFLDPVIFYLPKSIWSFVQIFISQLIPVFLVLFSKFFLPNIFSYFVIFTVALSRGFSSTVMISMYGSCAWLIRLIIHSPGVVSSVLSLWLLLKYRNRQNLFHDFVIIIVLIIFSSLFSICLYHGFYRNIIIFL